MEQIKLQTLLIVLGIIVAVLSILEKILIILEKLDERAKQKAQIRKTPPKHKRK